MPARRVWTRFGAGFLAGAGLLAMATAAVAVPAPERVASAIPPAGGSSTSTSIPTTVAARTTTAPLSPLNSLLGGTVSVIPVPVTPRPTPARVAIEALGVDYPVRAVGLEDDGQLEIPDETEVGWYSLGSSPGRVGSIVMAGHVSWNDTIGPFFRLVDLEVGARIVVTIDDGSLRTYEVTERAQYPKTELPTERIWDRDGPETLVLITCGGEFNPDVRRYYDNIVVYAVPVA